MGIPALVAAIPPLVSGIKAFGSFLSKRKNKPDLFEHTFAGRLLKRQAKEGAITAKQRSRLLSREGMRAGNLASKSRARVRGRLSAGGLNQSIAGSRAIEEAGFRAESQLSSFGERLDIANERSKGEAELALRQGKDQSRVAKRQWRASLFSDALTGIADTAEASGTAFSNFTQTNPLLERLDDALADGDFETAELIIAQLAALGG